MKHHQGHWQLQLDGENNRVIMNINLKKAKGVSQCDIISG